MRYSLFFYLLLAGTILTWPSCDDETINPPAECFEGLPDLAISTGCTPTLYEFTNLNDFPDNDGLVLPADCTNANDRGQIIKITPPASGVINVHIYNGTYGYVNAQLFTANNCDEDLIGFSSCFSTDELLGEFGADGLFADNLYLRIDVSASGPGEPFEEYDAEDGQSVSIAVWEGTSEPSRSVSYGGYEVESGIQRLFFSCDGLTTQRIILGSCNPNANVNAWLEEVGLTTSETYTGPGGTTTAADIPPGFDPNTSGTALRKRRPRQNTGDFFAEQDLLISVPVPNEGTFTDANDFQPQQPTELFADCLDFALGTPSGEDKDQQIIVTMVDSGVDVVTPENRAYWENHRNISLDNRYAPIGSLGFDFIAADDLPNDEFGHGTNTAGALIGDYDGGKELTVLHNKIFAFEPGYGVWGTYFGAVVAINVAIENESDIINASFGSSPDDEPQALRCAIAAANDRGIYVVTSAGNDDADIGAQPQWPAAFSVDFERVITVGSWLYPNGLDSKPAKPFFSNFNETLVTTSAYLTAKTPRYLSPTFNYLTGTSISAPLVAGALAEELDPMSREAPGFDARFRMSDELFGIYSNQSYLPVCPDLIGGSD